VNHGGELPGAELIEQLMRVLLGFGCISGHAFSYGTVHASSASRDQRINQTDDGIMIALYFGLRAQQFIGGPGIASTMLKGTWKILSARDVHLIQYRYTNPKVKLVPGNVCSVIDKEIYGLGQRQ